jgi:hypothetical protein
MKIPKIVIDVTLLTMGIVLFLSWFAVLIGMVGSL